MGNGKKFRRKKSGKGKRIGKPKTSYAPDEGKIRRKG